MKILAEVNEPEFELQFLSTEWYKPFYDSLREQYNELVTNPDLSDWKQNYARKELLWKWRYPLLGQLPQQIEWYLIELDLEEFENLLVIRENGWDKTFGLGKNLEEVALAVQNDVEDSWGVNFKQIKDIKNNIGKYAFKEKIILISSNEEAPYTILEGNHRAVAFELKKVEIGETDHIPKKFLLGISPNMGQAHWLNSRQKIQ